MALTKVTLTGAVNTIKEAWTKFNNLIDDLAATTSGLGASTIGLEDSAGNVAATDLEAFAAEIYTDVTEARSMADTLDENPATTTALNWGYKGGIIRVDNTVTAVAAATIGLTNGQVNYVELNQSGAMTKNITAFTTGYIPIRQVTCAGGIQTVSTDKRAWLAVTPDATIAQEGVVELATDGETQTGIDTARAITPANLTARTATVTRTGIAELATATETYLGTDAERIITPSAARLLLHRMHVGNRSRFTYKDADEIYLERSVYRSEGATNRMVYNTSQLTYTFTTLAANKWSYLYIDDSDLETDGTNILTAARLTDVMQDTAEPAYSATKEGVYNENDLCIFAVLADGSGNILEFFHMGDFVLFADEISNYTDDLETSWVDVTLSLPVFCTSGEAVFYENAGGAGERAICYWRVNGQTGSTCHRVALSGNSNVTDEQINTCRVITDSSQIIEVKHDVAEEHTLSVYTSGWYFPNFV